MRRAFFIGSLLLAACNFDSAFEERCRKTLAGEDGGFDDPTLCPGFDGGTGDSGTEPVGGGIGPLMGGGGGSGGGVTGGGGGGGGGGDGDGGVMCESRASGCFGSGEWCWENPYPMGNDLFVVWTTADAGGVWAAGAGPTLLYWDGVKAFDRTPLLTQRPSTGFDEPGAITGVTQSTDGVWLVGKRVDLLRATASTNFRSQQTGDWLAITTDPLDRVYAVNAASRYRLNRLDTASGDSMAFDFDVMPGPPRIHSVLVDDASVALVTTESDSQVFRFDVSATDGGVRRFDGGSSLVVPGGFVGPIAATATDVWVGGVDHLYRYTGSGWVDAGIPFGGSFTRSMSWSAPNLWVFGGAGNVYEFSSQMNFAAAPTEIYGSAPQTGGGAWIVGAHGMLADVNPAGVVSPLWRVASYGVRNLFVSEGAQVIAIDETIRARDGNGTWSVIAPLSDPDGHQWIAVAAISNGQYFVWAIDRSGTLYRAPVIGTAEPVAQFSPPYIDYHPRSAATLQLPDGGVLLAFGRTIVRLTADAVFTFDGAPTDGGFSEDGGVRPELDNAPLAMISGLAINGSTLAITGHVSTGNTNTDFSRVLTRPLNAAGDAGWTPVFSTGAGERIDDISTCPSGGFVFAGDHQILRRIAAGANTSTNAWVTQPVDVDFASVWCAPNEEAWTLTRHGDVYRYAIDGGLARERTGWGRLDTSNDPIDACTIRGNRTMVFITGGSEAVLSSPLCR